MCPTYNRTLLCPIMFPLLFHQEQKKQLFYLFIFFKLSFGSGLHSHKHSRNQPKCASFCIEMKVRNTHFYAHICICEARPRHAQKNRHKHTGKKHKPFGTGSLSREGFKAH
ncbi:hypothetical protein ATANTOWER_020044 [Ataeniobius toweri]|uniref:Secreted protein n=1 Tax=Ataeniobius toweri TaxID=208326 RepID=A0ABU7AKJ0_9TELE|nr:hypothetical protein [Ataeniobius toweri]